MRNSMSCAANSGADADDLRRIHTASSGPVRNIGAVWIASWRLVLVRRNTREEVANRLALETDRARQRGRARMIWRRSSWGAAARPVAIAHGHATRERASRALTGRHHLTPNVSGKYDALVLHPPEHVAVDPPTAGTTGEIVGPHT